jgi:polar amino acid transport system substrate-binding protein
MKPLRFLATFALCFWFSVAACFAQTVQSGILRWAGDAQGGAPYVLKDPRQPDKTIGFEVDLANALARRMGMTAEFVQNQWDGLIPGLQAGHYDIALNGIEITPEREQEVLFSRPYYATSEQITVREGTANVAGLEDLRGKKVATLKASLAERYLTEFNAAKSANVQIASYDDQNTAYEDLALNRVEAVLMDFPIALYCADPARMKNVGEPIGAMRYGIAIRKKNRALLQRVDVALAETVRSGEVREIYQKWGLWNKETQELFRAQFPDSPNAWTGETGTIGKNLTDYQAATFKPVSFTERLRKYAFVYLPLLLTRGATMTLLVSVCAMIFAIALGMVLAFGNLYGPGLVRVFCRAYVELVRGTPLLVQLYLIYYGLPRIGI